MTTVLENLGSKQQEDVSSLTIKESNDYNSISMSLSSVGSKKTAKEKKL